MKNKPNYILPWTVGISLVVILLFIGSLFIDTKIFILGIASDALGSLLMTWYVTTAYDKQLNNKKDKFTSFLFVFLIGLPIAWFAGISVLGNPDGTSIWLLQNGPY